MKLYGSAISGNSYKVRLLLAQLSIACEIVPVDILKGESRTAEFLRINPNGRTPVLDDEGFGLAASNAILAYLTRRDGRIKAHAWLVLTNSLSAAPHATAFFNGPERPRGRAGSERR